MPWNRIREHKKIMRDTGVKSDTAFCLGPYLKQFFHFEAMIKKVGTLESKPLLLIIKPVLKDSHSNEIQVISPPSNQLGYGC